MQNIDFITWGLWLIGLIILIVWIIIPVREFKNLVKKRWQQSTTSSDREH